MIPKMEFDEQSGRKIADWSWNAPRARLTIEAPRGEFYDLTGVWSLSGVAVMLEGYSRARLNRAFSVKSGEISCGLTLLNGRRVRLLGQFVSDEIAQGRLVREDRLAQADHTSGSELQPAYQPIISVSTGTIVGFEALARWTQEAEDLNDRLEDEALASDMLSHAAEAVADWRTRAGYRNLFVHVNLTGRDLARGNIPSLVANLVERHRLPNGVLKVELTEQAALRDPQEAKDMAVAIKRAGAGLILDDFGSGHSSFAWLADMPADGLKIDPDFTARMGEPRTDTILEAITLMATRLNMTSTAEGVESLEMAARLRALGFDYVQGFAFAKPMPRDAVVDYLMDYARPDEA